MVPGGFSWFFKVQVSFCEFSRFKVGFSWLQVGFHDSRLVFHDFMWIFKVIYGFQVGFYGYSWFQVFFRDSRLILMVFMVQRWFICKLRAEGRSRFILHVFRSVFMGF